MTLAKEGDIEIYCWCRLTLVIGIGLLYDFFPRGKVVSPCTKGWVAFGVPLA
jgi:hypothetical protein